MKSITQYLSVLLLVVVCMQAKAQSPVVDSVSFATPEATFDVLVKAINTKDIELYRQCWDPERVEWEGIASGLTDVPGQWELLQGFVAGEVKLVDGKEYIAAGERKMIKYLVRTQDGNRGLEHATLVKNGDKWQMYSW